LASGIREIIERNRMVLVSPMTPSVPRAIAAGSRMAEELAK